jgi:hypothetical protein
LLHLKLAAIMVTYVAGFVAVLNYFDGVPTMQRFFEALFVFLLGLTLAISVTLTVGAVKARAHDVYTELTKGSQCQCNDMERRCEPVHVTVRKERPDHYYLPATDEFFPRDKTGESPDERFHRCTDTLNMMWGGAPDPRWIEVPNNSTRDGKPRTKCLWAPNVGW